MCGHDANTIISPNTSFGDIIRKKAENKQLQVIIEKILQCSIMMTKQSNHGNAQILPKGMSKLHFL